MELSTEIPKVMLKINAVLAFKGISKKPISPAVIINARRLGTSEIIIILTLAKRIAIERVMSTNASNKLSCRFDMRNLFPLMNIFDDPVIVVAIESRSVEVNIDFIRGSIARLTKESSLADPISAIWHEILILLNVVSTKDL